MEQNKVHRDLQYDLISSPMMINDLFRKMQLPSIGSSCSEHSDRQELSSPQLLSVKVDALERGLASREAQQYNQSLIGKADGSLLDLNRDLSPSQLISQVSVYSGPLHNDRMATMDEQPTASLADRLANARMMQKSGYTWDPAGSCAKIRLGDGAILQNLYPSHSHVKLRNGTVERIDAYCQRMIDNQRLLSEITMIKPYEYNQWARTRALNTKDYETSKPVPIEKIESKSTQPSWDTLRPMNSSLIHLGAKNRLFSYEDLASKFSQPKFLKRMGFIDSIADYNSRKSSIDDESNENAVAQTEYSVETGSTGKDLKAEPMEVTEDSRLEHGEMTADDVEDESEELSSDDEEYHKDQEDDALLTIPSERVPSSKRSNRQRLSIYKEELVIGSKSSVDKSSELVPERHELLKNESDKATVSLSTVKLVDDLINQNNGANFASRQSKSRSGSFHSRPMRRDSLKLEIPAKLHRVDKNFVRFSQPVCLCPKLSKETLNSFYSPTMQKYLSTHTNGFMKCQLHNSSRHPRIRDKIILKSL